MSAAPLNRDLFTALVDELGVVIAAMIDSPASAAPGAPAMGRQWLAHVRADGELTGSLTVVFDHDGAAAMTALMTGIEGAIPDEALLDTIREVVAQAAGALALKPVARGAKFVVGDVRGSENHLPDGDWSAFAITAEKMPVPLAVTASAAVTTAQSASAARGDNKPASTGAPAASTAPDDATLDERIGVILDIDLPLVVRFGRTELPLRAITRLGPGSVIDLGRSPDDPVEILVSNRVVARGEVVIVSGNYGIRILDVVSQRERVRSMEA